MLVWHSAYWLTQVVLETEFVICCISYWMSEAVASIIKQPRMQVTIFIDTLSSVIWYQKNIDSKWRYLHIFEQVWKSSSPTCVIINHVILHCLFHKASRQCKLLCRSLTNLRTYSSVRDELAAYKNMVHRGCNRSSILYRALYNNNFHHTKQVSIHKMYTTSHVLKIPIILCTFAVTSCFV